LVDFRVTLAASIACLLLAAGALPAQRLIVYSEFRRVAPDGKIIEADRPGSAREILSPAVPRGAYSSFRLVVEMPAGKPFTLHLGSNPENVVQPTLYRERYTRNGSGAWIPDRLDRVDVPFSATLPDANAGVKDQTAMSFWLDVYVPSQAPIRRVRLEAQLSVDDRWIIYPLEIRVQAAIVPRRPESVTSLAPFTANAAETALAQLDTYLCGAKPKPTAIPSPTSPRFLAFRNSQQDLALLQALDAKLGRDKVLPAILNLLGANDAKAWCGHARPASYDPETYLKVRDYLIRGGVN
jgi:hypothetical protein